MAEFFTDVPEPIRYAGPDSDDPLAFRWYDADRVVGERTMAEHLRIAVVIDGLAGPSLRRDRRWLRARRDQVLVDGVVGDYSSGNGNCSHHGRSTGSTRLTHLTHQKPRRPGATSLTGAPWPRRSGSPP